MRRPSPFQHRRDLLDVKMTPMIDVVFLLLIFFVWTSSFRIDDQVMRTQISAAAGTAPQPIDAVPPPEADFPDVEIRILWVDGMPQWKLTNRTEPLARLEQVRAYLQQIFDVNQAATVVIDPDSETPWENVIDVYDLTRLVGFGTVQFPVSQGG